MYNHVMIRLANLILKQVLIVIMTAINGSAADVQNWQKLKFSLPPKLQMLKSSNMHIKAAVKF